MIEQSISHIQDNGGLFTKRTYLSFLPPLCKTGRDPITDAEAEQTACAFL